MESPKPNGHTGQCMCCLNKTYLRHMWLPHNCKGEWLVYGQMLVDCFGIEWTQNVDDDSICQVCVSKLLVSVAFKKQVQESHATLQKNVPALSTEVLINSEISHEIEIPSEKIEIQILPDTEVPTIETDTEFSKEDEQEFTQELVKREKNENQLNITVSKYEVDSDAEPQENVNGCIRNFEDVEFLEEEVLEAEDDSEKGEERDDQEYVPVIKRPRMRMPANRRSQIYKQYTEEDLMKALEAVKSNKMNRLKASEVFNIPRKTISAKLFAERDPPKEDPYIKLFIKAIRAILTHTNATPFKIRAIHKGYSCFFCSIDGPYFKNPEELRTHTHTVHKDKVYRTEFMIRPYHLNQMIRFDIEDLTCKCKEEITWSDLLDHLKTRHGISGIEEPWRKIVPYTLQVCGAEMSCTVCNYSSGFSNMDTHMNSHFPNFVCGDCGRPYVTLYRLRSHEQFHRVGVFPCIECNLVFSSKKVRRTHIDTVHEKKLRFLCTICQKKFLTDQSKLKHLKEEHKDKLETMGRKCQFCGKLFWTRDYWRHMSRVHRKLYCEKCGEGYRSQELLDEHTCKEAVVEKRQRPKKVQRETVVAKKEESQSEAEDLEETENMEEREDLEEVEDIEEIEEIRVPKKRKQSDQKKVYLYLCAKCNKSFESPKLLSAHSCKEDTVKKFQCDVCFKCYFTARAVETHKKQGQCQNQ